MPGYGSVYGTPARTWKELAFVGAEDLHQPSAFVGDRVQRLHLDAVDAGDRTLASAYLVGVGIYADSSLPANADFGIVTEHEPIGRGLDGNAA